MMLLKGKDVDRLRINLEPIHLGNQPKRAHPLVPISFARTGNQLDSFRLELDFEAVLSEVAWDNCSLQVAFVDLVV